LSGSGAQAAVVQIGDQDFADGTILGVSLFDSAAAGEPAPFNGFIGTDPGGFDFRASWAFSFPEQEYTGGVFTLGIYDHDSQTNGYQIRFFGFDGNDLTSVLNAEFEASGGRQVEYNVYSVSLPASSLSSLVDGIASFTLSLKGPTLGSPLPVAYASNGAGLDFARLELRESVAEPATLTLLGLGLAGLGAMRRKKLAA
jgi:hypothetical protein